MNRQQYQEQLQKLLERFGSILDPAYQEDRVQEDADAIRIPPGWLADAFGCLKKIKRMTDFSCDVRILFGTQAKPLPYGMILASCRMAEASTPETKLLLPYFEKMIWLFIEDFNQSVEYKCCYCGEATMHEWGMCVDHAGQSLNALLDQQDSSKFEESFRRALAVSQHYPSSSLSNPQNNVVNIQGVYWLQDLMLPERHLLAKTLNQMPVQSGEEMRETVSVISDLNKLQRICRDGIGDVSHLSAIALMMLLEHQPPQSALLIWLTVLDMNGLMINEKYQTELIALLQNLVVRKITASQFAAHMRSWWVPVSRVQSFTPICDINPGNKNRSQSCC